MRSARLGCAALPRAARSRLAVRAARFVGSLPAPPVSDATFDVFVRSAAAEGAAVARWDARLRADCNALAGAAERPAPAPGPTVVVAVSGGPDSVALAVLATRWARARGHACVLATVDHGLRPESGAEATGVAAALGAALGGVPHCIARLAWPAGPPPARELEAVARTRRYDALAGVCRRVGARVVLTAHHAGDQVETALMRFGRASGVAGLAGMAAASVHAHGFLLLRPLLQVPKHQLAAVAAGAGLPTVADPMNVDEAYDRVRVRAAVAAAPALGEAWRRAAAAVQRVRKALADAGEGAWGGGSGMLDDQMTPSSAQHRIAVRTAAPAGSVTVTPLGAVRVQAHALARLLDAPALVAVHGESCVCARAVCVHGHASPVSSSHVCPQPWVPCWEQRAGAAGCHRALQPRRG